MIRRLPRLLALAASALPLPLCADAQAAPVAAKTNATGTATVLRPLSVLKVADLDFGGLIVAGAGTAVVNPNTGALTTTGPLTRVGTTVSAAKFTTSGSRNSIILIRIPQQPITLTRVGGTQTMTVSNFTLDGSTNQRVFITNTVDFQVGGRLNVAAGQAEGNYLGTFTVTVQYP